MSENKHTPGPWTAKRSKHWLNTFIVQTEHPSNRIIASFDDDGDVAGEQSIADARLIAAAPDLLEALKQAANQLSKVHDDAFKQAAGYGLVTSDGRDFSCLELNKCTEVVSAIRAVIAKAEGAC